MSQNHEMVWHKLEHRTLKNYSNIKYERKLSYEGGEELGYNGSYMPYEGNLWFICRQERRIK